MTTDSLPATATIHPLLAQRWSTRAFDPDAVLDQAVLDRLLEAARWSPSANNSQPWRFALAVRGTPEHTALAGALMGFNQAWAPDASALLLVVARTRAQDGREQPWAVFDTGQALAHLSVQAAADGVAVHTMAGFDADAVRDLYDLGEDARPVVVVALGRPGDASRLPEQLREREAAPRERAPLPELLLAPAAGGPAPEESESARA